MPQITVTLAEGRTPEQIRTLQHEVHEAVLRSIDTRPEYIRVVVHEVPATHWSTGDTTLAEMRATAIAMEKATPTSAKELS
ncbi:4-oxalocrotonate tautomerase family protein [Streptomyces sp. NPDC102364]|uniref:tautomerase family protein n=1 Tax=Streptomyces sp. NPDC102364 TaxID=3366161 RepID=UPI0037FFEE28